METKFDKLYDEGEDRKNLGYDYKETLLKNSLSNRMFKNDILSAFIGKINTIMVEAVDSVKLIKTFFNYTVHKDDRKIR